MPPQMWQHLREIKALNERAADGARGRVQAHEGSSGDRMQRHQMEREIIDGNMITWIMMMAKMQGLKGSSTPERAAAAVGNAFVGTMETGP